MNKILCIDIIKDFLQFSFIENEEDEPTDFFINGQCFFTIDILFMNNIYKISTGNSNTKTQELITEFVSEIIQNPENYTTYTVQFCDKEYQLTGECLLAIILNHLIQISLKQTKINQIQVEINSDEINIPLISYLRIKNALKFIEFENLEVFCNYEEEVSMEEEEENEETIFLILKEMKQDELFKQIIEMNNSNTKRKTNIIKLLDETVIHLNSLRELDRDDEMGYELDGIIDKLKQMKQTNTYSDKEMKELEEIVKSYHFEVLPFSLKRMFNCNQLDQYTMYLSMMYLDTIDDMINVVLASKRFQHILERFFYNPFSMNEKTVEFFPSLRTLHLYNKNDKKIEKQQIQSYVIHYPVPYYLKETYSKQGIICKQFEFTRETLFDEYTITFENIKILGKCCMKQNQTIGYIYIPSNITEIKDYCFSQCYNLTKVILPNTLTSLPNRCFSYCCALKEIQLPSTIEKLGEGTFECCNNLEQIIIPSKVKELPTRCFYYCDNLQNDQILTQITSIGSECFRNCKHLKKVELSTSLKIIESNSFSKCLSLQSLQIPESVTRLDNRIFHGCESLTYIYLPSIVSSLSEYSLNGMELIKDIILPDSITSISDYCFSFCNSLTHIHFPSSLKRIGSNCFCNCFSIESIEIPTTVTFIGNNCFHKLDSIKDIFIPNSISSILDFCFYSCSQLTNISLSESIKKIGDNCFRELSSIQYIDIPDSVTSIGRCCFEKCNRLINIHLSSSLSTIPYECFLNWN